MKIYLIAYFLLVSLISYGQNKKEISPRKSFAKVILSGKRDYTYYALSEKSTTEYKVNGPGMLAISIRVRLEPGQLNSEPFKIKYMPSEKKIEIIKVPELLPEQLKFKSKTLKGKPSKSHKLDIYVPPGVHSYKFYKHKAEQKAHIRVFYTADTKPVFEDIEPISKMHTKKLRFIKSGTTRTYYKITKQDGFDFSITDSSRLRIIVRPEFTYKMLDETVLKIKLKNETTGKSKVYKINSHKSNSAEFVSDKNTIPGTSRTFYINLYFPKGINDKYSMKIVSGSKAAVVRISKDKTFFE